MLSVVPSPSGTWAAALERPVLFFGGKGGVGKTTLASATAVLFAGRGERTLLVSTDPAHSTSDALGVRLRADPTLVSPSLWAAEIDPAEAADHYIAEVKARIAETTPPRLAAEVERQIDIARVSPGAEEAALFDRFTRFMADAGAKYDHVVFDTAPLGHTLRLLALPEQLTAWIAGLIGRRRRLGVVRRMWRNVAGAAAGSELSDADPVLAALEERKTRFAAARATVTDCQRAAFIFVVTPEWLPVVETDRAVQTLRRYGIPVGAVLVNRVVPDEADGVFVARRRRDQAAMRAEIVRRFAAVPVKEIPLLARDVRGPDELHTLVSVLAPERSGGGR